MNEDVDYVTADANDEPEDYAGLTDRERNIIMLKSLGITAFFLTMLLLGINHD